MKVLMLGNDSSVKGGITSVINQLMEYDWNADEIEMKFIPTYIETSNVKKIAFFINSYRKIMNEFKYNKPDVVHIHMSYKGSFIRKYKVHILCKKYGVPDIIHLHGSEFKKWYDKSGNKKKNQIRTLMKECSTFIVLGEKWNKAVKKIEPQTKTLVVTNTVKIPKTTVQWSDSFKVLFMGVLIQRKGVADLLNAVGILKNDGKMNNVKFVIAGSGSEAQKLKNLCTELKINDNVEFVGWTSGQKKTELFESCQMLALPSYNEGLPIAILEAISYGMPIVATDVGDISSAVRNGENGFLIHPGDVVKLATNINKIYTNKMLYESMNLSSRKLAEENFSDDKYYTKIKECYRSIVENVNNEKFEI